MRPTAAVRAAPAASRGYEITHKNKFYSKGITPPARFFRNLLEQYCRFLATKFLGIYPQAEGLQICAVEIPHAALQPGSAAFAPAGPECFTTRLEMNRAATIEITSGIQGFRLLRLGGSAFHGFVRDE